MDKSYRDDIIKSSLRVVSITAAAVLVLWLAKIWLLEPLNTEPPSRQPNTGETAAKESSVPVISWRDASRHYGEFARVEGKIIATHNSGKACFLNFHSDYRRHFTVVIFASAFNLFPPDPQEYYRGKNVRVSGYVKEYNGKPEIIVNDPGQIEILK